MAYSLFEPDPPDHLPSILKKLRTFVLHSADPEDGRDTASSRSPEQTFGPHQMDARQRQIYLRTVFEGAQG